MPTRTLQTLSSVYGPKNPDTPPIFEKPPERPDRGQKEDMSGETRTYGNPV